jgi:hypothetical protein
VPCNPLITDPFVFPRRADNRPGLPRMAYRIGRYADFVEAMVRGIDAAPELSAWTHRDADDPGIALLEGAAILGDILSFYQEHYANEAYLRTAAWRESVAELVRLTGYRLAPGIGGRATLAFEARGDKAVTIPEGFAVKAELAEASAPADFQTDAELLAWPHLGRFNLYRARQYQWFIAAAQNRVEVASADGANDSSALDALDLKKGDRLLLLQEENVFAFFLQLWLGWTLEQPAEEIVIVDKVEHSLGRVILTLAGNFTHPWLIGCRAFKLGRTFKHYGANAPPQYVTTDTSVSPPETTSTATTFTRELFVDTNYGTPYSFIAPQTFPLDQEVGDLASGSTVVVTGSTPYGAFLLPFAVARGVTAVRNGAPQWGNLSSPASFAQLDDLIAPAWSRGYAAQGDVRTLRLHETKGPGLTLRPVATGSDSPFANGTNALRFWGTATQVQALAGRRLYLSHADGRSAELVCTNAATDFTPPTPDVAKMWPLNFDRPPAPFARSDFDEAAPTVTVFGNLVDASQGKAERDAVLGNGDNRQMWQTFPLPKSPLTYFLTAGGIPPHTPELEIWVNNRLWTRVDAFYGHGPTEQIYIVREDAEGRSFVQFGDGETGARLPSGLKNVVAVYRSGVGAHGAIKPGATPTASQRPPGFDKVTLAGIVSGGAEPEDGEKAREAAPGKVQSLGRLVSIRDYETETLAVAGVVIAAAAWDLHDGVPAVILRVLLEAGREAEFDDVRATLAHAQRCSGPDRFALVVQQALLRYAFVDVSYALDPSYRQEDVEAAVRAALGLVGDTDNERSGLFGLRARRLGDREYASRIEGRVQSVAGVLWCKVTALELFAAGATDPDALVLPASPRPLSAVLPCSPHELLQLATQHLTLTSVAEPSAGVCA